jgi:hypothetical protein
VVKANTLIATIEPDHTIRLPSYLPVGEQVLIVRIPSIDALLNDSSRRTRFAATRKAIQEAMQSYHAPAAPSNAEIVQLVKRARRTTSGQS